LGYTLRLRSAVSTPASGTAQDLTCVVYLDTFHVSPPQSSQSPAELPSSNVTEEVAVFPDETAVPKLERQSTQDTCWSPRHQPTPADPAAPANGIDLWLGEHGDKQHEEKSPGSRFDREAFYIGQRLDVLDTAQQWLDASVVKLGRRSERGSYKVFITYTNWPPRWNEWIENTSRRIQPLHKHTKPKSSTERLARKSDLPEKVFALSLYRTLALFHLFCFRLWRTRSICVCFGN